jgi:protein-S-isoprenylcysteine O-methyltransferase Ste14
MDSPHRVLTLLVAACWLALGTTWLVAAAYFALRRPAPPARKLAAFVRTLLPEPWFLLAVPVAAVVLSLVPSSAWARLVLVSPPVQGAGAVLLVASTALTLWARVVLGRMWAGRPLVQEDHELRTSGPYHLVRHPIYTGLAGMVLGTAMVLGFGETLVLPLCAVPLVAWRVWAEERMMVATFGERYLQYRRRVPALVPSPRRLLGA